MNDPKKSAEALKKIQDIQQKIKGHSAKIAQIENEKKLKIRSFDQQIASEQEQVKRHMKSIDELKRQI